MNRYLLFVSDSAGDFGKCDVDFEKISDAIGYLNRNIGKSKTCNVMDFHSGKTVFTSKRHA